VTVRPESKGCPQIATDVEWSRSGKAARRSALTLTTGLDTRGFALMPAAMLGASATAHVLVQGVQ